MKFKIRISNCGFTLTELLVAMGMSGIVMASVYSVVYSQQKTYVAQEQVIEMQQNLRAAMFYMERDIMMAGCDPTPTQDANAGILTAGANTFGFTSDADGDGVAGSVTYSLADNDGDGDNDLERNGTLIAENIDALDFVYLRSDGNPTATISQIRLVQVTIVARTGRGDPGYTDTAAYVNKRGTEILPAQNDNFRRRVLRTTIKCRNLGP